jgi:hypothetical protein
MEAKDPVDISPDKLKADAEAVQEIMARYIGDQCQCGGLGVASYGIARYIAKRIQSDLKECQEARDGWCAAFTELRDNPQKPS